MDRYIIIYIWVLVLYMVLDLKVLGVLSTQIMIIRHDYLVMWCLLIKRKYVNIIQYTKGYSIYNVVEICFSENNILPSNTVLCATDGVPTMVGRHRGFLSY